MFSRFPPAEYSERLPPSNMDGRRIITITIPHREFAHSLTRDRQSSFGARSTGKNLQPPASASTRNFLWEPHSSSETKGKEENKSGHRRTLSIRIVRSPRIGSRAISFHPGTHPEYYAVLGPGAGRGNRTPTELSPLRILSPLRLPISPSRPVLPHHTLHGSHSVNIAQALHSCQFVCVKCRCGRVASLRNCLTKFSRPRLSIEQTDPHTSSQSRPLPSPQPQARQAVNPHRHQQQRPHSKQ
jgi:hypothetical protein